MDQLSPTVKAARPRFMSNRLWRSPGAWIILMAVGAFLIAACSGGSESSRTTGNGAGPAIDGNGGRLDQDMAFEVPTAPDFELMVFGNENHAKGELIRLSQFVGQPVVINFWFPSCPPCRAEMPDLEKTFKNHKQDRVEFIGVQLVGLDTAEDGQAFIEKLGISYAVGPDEKGDIFQDYDVTNFPTTIFLDRDHEIVRKWGGILNAEKLEELIQEAL